RVLTAQLQTDWRQCARRGCFDRPTATHRPGKIDEVELPFADQLESRRMVEENVLKHVRRHSSFGEGAHRALADQRSLRSVLQDDAVACNERRHDGIHRGQIRVVPWRDYEHDPMRLPYDCPQERIAVLDQY